MFPSVPHFSVGEQVGVAILRPEFLWRDAENRSCSAIKLRIEPLRVGAATPARLIDLHDGSDFFSHRRGCAKGGDELCDVRSAAVFRADPRIVLGGKYLAELQRREPLSCAMIS